MKKITKAVSGLLAALMATSALTTAALSVNAAITATADDAQNAGEQLIYFEYPTDGTWGDASAVKINKRTGRANVFCYVYAIYGNEYEFFDFGWETLACACKEVEGRPNVYSYDLNSTKIVSVLNPETGNKEKKTLYRFMEENPDVDYGIIFSTTNGGGFQTADLNMDYTCIGDTVTLVTPRQTRMNVANSAKSDYFSQWQNHPNFETMATISSIGTFFPGQFPAHAPRAKMLADTLKIYLTNPITVGFFNKVDNNRSLCESTESTPLDVYRQYYLDNRSILDNAVVEPADDNIPVDFVRYMGKNANGEDEEKKMASLHAVQEVLGLSDEEVEGVTDITEPTTEPVTETTTEPVEASTDEPQETTAPTTDAPEETTAPATDAPEETTAPAAQETTVPAGEEITPRAASSVESGNFKGETLTVKLSLENAVSGTYCLDDSTPVSFTDGMAIKIGSDYNYNETITLTLTATGGDGTKATNVYKYKKLQNDGSGIYIWLNPAKKTTWKGPYNVFVYDEETYGKNQTYTNAPTWPGEEMSYDAEQKLYYYEIPKTSYLNGELTDFDLSKSSKTAFIINATDIATNMSAQFPAPNSSGILNPQYLNGQSWEYAMTSPRSITQSTRTPTVVDIPATEATRDAVENPTEAPTTEPVEEPTTEPVEAPTDEPETWYVVGNNVDMLGRVWAADEANIMTLGADGKYTKVYTNVAPTTGGDPICIMVTNIGEWIGNKYGKNIVFEIDETCDVTVTFDPNLVDATQVTVTGEHVRMHDFSSATVEQMAAVGAGQRGFLDDESWNLNANIMTEEAPGVYTIEYEDVDAAQMQFKFAANGSWIDSFGAADDNVKVGKDNYAIYDGNNNIYFVVCEDGSKVKLTLDISDFNYETYTGATYKVQVWGPDGEEVIDEGEPTDPSEKQILSLDITRLPDKTSYVYGEALDLSGLQVTAVYNGFSIESVTDYDVTPLQNTIGEQTVTLTYEGKTASFNVWVGKGELTDLILENAPNKRHYQTGEALDLTGMILVAEYDSGYTEYVTDCEAEANLNEEGYTVPVTLTYGGKSVSYTVRVTAPVLLGINISKTPDKIQYLPGEAFDPAGMTVTAFYNDGTDRQVTDYTVSPMDAQGGVQQLTVSWQDKTALLTVVVYPLGDVNKDGIITIADVTLLQKALVDLVTLDESERQLADFNQDGEISIADATIIQMNISQ